MQDREIQVKIIAEKNKNFQLESEIKINHKEEKSQELLDKVKLIIF